MRLQHCFPVSYQLFTAILAQVLGQGSDKTSCTGICEAGNTKAQTFDICQ